MTANTLKQAMAASTQERVRMIHPDWTPEEIAAEVKRILDEGVPATAFAVSPMADDATAAAPDDSGGPEPPAPGRPAVPPTPGPTPGAPAPKPPMPSGVNRS